MTRLAPRLPLLITASSSLFAICVALGLTGCLLASPDGERPQGDGEDEPVPTPVPQPQPQPPVAIPGGTYQVTTQLDLTAELLLPEPAAQLVVTLRDFSTEPAHTLIDLADEAGVPAVAELRAALPDALESRLEGWIDDEIAELMIEGAPVTQRAAELAALAEATLTQVNLQSELVLDSARATHATHRLTAIDLRPAGLEVVLPLAALPADVVSATAPVTATPAALALGDHQFALAYGEYAWRALQRTSVATYGAELRPLLGAAISCPALAAKLANKCVLGVCVGHAAALTQLCERGLDEVVDRAHAKLTAVRFTALRLAAGEAAVRDGANRLDGGVWSAQADAGLGLRAVPATFTAAR